MKSNAASVEEYLAELPPERRAALQDVRQVILKNLDKNYEEGMQYGMIGYYVPHRIHPAGYHCDPKQPLPFAALGSQKNHLSIYLMCVYGGTELRDWFESAWAKTGKKLDAGKACIRFKRAEDLALDVIGEAVRRVPAKRYVEFCTSFVEAAKKGASRANAKRKQAAKKAAKSPARKKSNKKGAGSRP
jgi:hypothetical protein